MNAAGLVLRAGGAIEILPKSPTLAEIRRLVGASALDTVRLRDGTVMWVDDNGHARGLPRNERATERYLSVCHPGTTHFIVGDAVICPEGAIL